ncbi:response regulator transcription factor [Nocardioides salarius]|uniref:response regulator transcription factor n=1 Tax=Nocardioides salarius TaxID=374513 RepID=UPI0030FC90E9
MSSTGMSPSASSRSDTRVVIVEDHQLFAESLDLALTMDGYDVRRIAPPDASTTVASLLADVLRQRPRIVLLDLDLGAFGDTVRVIAPLVRSGADVVIVTANDDRGRWGECLQHGARTVVSKSDPLNGILAVVRRLHQALPVLALEEREALLRAWTQERRELAVATERLERLTRRERQVLGMLMLGRTVREIAALDVVSEATVRTQVKSILGKLEVSSQLAAVGLAHQLRWEPPHTP